MLNQLTRSLARRSFASASVSNEVKDASLIFNAAFDALESRVGRDALLFPKEIIWLGGAPGSGKGTNTNFILRERDIGRFNLFLDPNTTILNTY